MTYASVFKPGLFTGRTIIVTGGGTGIGRCTVHELASLGANVVLMGRREEPLKATCAEVTEDGGAATFFTCDTRDETRVQAVIGMVIQKFGRIDALVNNAGGQYISPLKDIKTKGWEAVIRNNLTGTFIFSREVYTQWMENNGGAIVNIVADFDGGWPYVGHSGAARAGMVSLTQTAAGEWAPAGVRVNAVAPGAILTSGEDTYSEDELTWYRDVISRIPMQRKGAASEVSAAITFLLSPAAAYITGTVLRVDGGSVNGRQFPQLTTHSNSIPFVGFHRDKLFHGNKG